MHSIFLLLLLVAVASCKPISNSLPTNFVVVGHYGKTFGTRKTYYHSTTSYATGTDHVAECTSVGLEPLQLSNIVEQEYFLNLIRNSAIIPIGDSHVGVVREGADWIWRGTRERINFSIHWFPGYPRDDSSYGCLLVTNSFDSNRAFGNLNCITYNRPYFCQSVGG